MDTTSTFNQNWIVKTNFSETPNIILMTTYLAVSELFQAHSQKYKYKYGN
jgi:hypothetical protein